jgi:serine/threonine-protein kinase
VIEAGTASSMSEAFKLAPHEWALLRSLLDEALALPAHERPAWLERLDPQRQRALKERLRVLLAHAADEGSDEPATAARLLATLPKVETHQFAALPGAAGEKAGDAIGPYRLMRELGSGGMGSVWLAERTDLLQGRQVALKLPHGAWKRAGLAERLAREREILATLEHRHIAQLHDAGVTPQGQPWLALEYVAGQRIDAHCRALRLTVKQRLPLFLQVARAVAHAHAHLVVHRDLKPANILVTEAGDVKLLDFGIAKLVQEGVVEETELTREAGRVLTPEYASPEQILGKPLGTASDVYSLGVLLFELLADVRPYPVNRASRAALEEAITRADVPRPSALAPAERRRLIRGDLDTIVLKALKREPAERYPTVAALADDVQRHLEQRPVLAQPDSAWYRARKFMRRNRLVLVPSAAVVVSLVAGTTMALLQAREAARQRDAALRQQLRAEAFGELTRGLLADAGVGNRPLTFGELLDRATASLERRTDFDTGTLAAMRYQVSRLYTAVVQTDRELKLLMDAAEGARRAEDPGLEAAALCAAAWSQMNRDQGAAQALFARARASLTRIASPPAEAVADCARAHSRLLFAAGDASGGIAAAREGLAALDRLAIRPADPRRRLLAVHLGNFYRLTDRHAEALEVNEQELELVRRAGGEGSLFEQVALSNIAGNLRGLGEFARAAQLYEQVLQWAQRTPEAGVRLAALRTNLATMRVFSNRFDEALALASDELHSARSTGNRTAEAIAWLVGARALHGLGRLDEADTWVAACEGVPSIAADTRARLTREAALLRGEVLLTRERPEQARSAVDQVLAELGHPARADAPGIDRALRLRARIALREGDGAQADRYAAQALMLSRRIARDERQSADVGEASLLRAEALVAQGHADAAMPHARLAREALANALGADHRLASRAAALALR